MIEAPSVEVLYWFVQDAEAVTPHVDSIGGAQDQLARLGFRICALFERWVVNKEPPRSVLTGLGYAAYDYLRVVGHDRALIERALLWEREDLGNWWGPDTDDVWKLLCLLQDMLGELCRQWRYPDRPYFERAAGAKLILAALAWRELVA